MKQISKKSAQEMQDEIFKKMSADKKVELGAQLWLLGKERAGDKIDFRNRIFSKFFNRDRQKN